MRADDAREKLTRREFLRRGAALPGAAIAAKEGLWGSGSVSSEESGAKGSTASPVVSGKTVLTFYVDDTNPYIAGVEPFKEFLDFVKANKIAGESSMILGFRWEEHGLIS
jgi:hypothetical protein